MLIQQFIIALVFVAAAGYLGRGVYNKFKPAKAGCAKGCATCSPVAHAAVVKK